MRAPVVDLTVAHTTSQCNVLPSNSSDPPAIVVNAAGSSPSEGLSSSVPHSSRYSSLLSVLEDVIGPDPTGPIQHGVDAMLSGPSSHLVTASSNSTVVTESDSTLVGHCGSEDSISSIASDPALPLDDTELAVPSGCGSPYVNPSLTYKTLDESSSLPAAVNSEEVVEYLTYEVDAAQPCEDNGVSHVVEAEEVATMEYDAEEFEQEPTTTPFRRQSVTSVASPFSGVSLLASPQDTCGKMFASSPLDTQMQVRTPDLLSPVQLSAKLRPFSLSPVCYLPQRGDSIDSGYAEGDSWIDPEPLSQSPPPKALPYLVSGSGYSHSLSSALPQMRKCELAYCMSSGHPSPSTGSIEASVPKDTEDSDDGTSSIIDIYESSSSDVEDCSSPTMKISNAAVPRETCEGEMSAPSNTGSSTATVTPPSGTFECSISGEPFVQPTNNESVSFRPALSAQPSFDFSVTSSRVSLLRQDSLLSSHSGSSTPNTSLFSQDGDSSRVEECLFLPNPANADHVMQSEMFWNVADDDTLHHQVLAPSQSIASIEQRFHSPQLGGTGDYEKLDTAIGTDANFPPCYSAPTRQGYLKAVQDLETDGHNVPQETVASFDLVPAEGVLQFPMPPVPTAESVTPSAFLGGDVTFQQVPQDGVGDMRSPPSTAKNHSMQLIHTPSGLAVDACPSEQKPAISGISSTSEDLDRSRTDASPADADRLFAHSPVFERPSLPAADGLGQASTKGCSKLSSPHSPDHQHMGDDFHDTHSNTSYTTSTPRGAGILASQESQHIALRSPRSPPCSSSPPAAALPPVSQSVLSRSGSVFRPLLTGRKSLLEASLFGDRISQNAFSARDRSISVSALSHSRAKEARSTSVSQNPLRYRQFSTHPPTPISDDGCSKRPLVNMAAVEESLSSHPRSHSAPPCRGLRPLRLSSNHTTRTFSSATSSSSIASAQSPKLNHINGSTIRSPSVLSSTISLGHNPLLSSPCHSLLEHNRNTLASSDGHSRTSPVSPHFQSSQNNNQSQCSPPSTSGPTQPSSWRLSNYRANSRSYTAADRWPSRRNSTLSFSYVPGEEVEIDGSLSPGPDQSIHGDHIPRPASASEGLIHAIATPKPTLLFAIASDDVEQVRKVLDSGEAGPNDPVGPQSALAFTLTNDKLARRNDIVKVLLAYGADPSALRNPALNPTARAEGNVGPPPETTLEGMDPATRYFMARADNAHTRQTSRLIYRSFFRPLTRVRYDVVGQDWALEQLFRVLSMHSQRLAVAPIVVLLCGPSGHGKSLLARKFGSLLEVPTHTVNMTTLRSTHDIWQSHSMSPYEEPSSYTLAEFLIANEGKRCVVVLDEIEKTEDQKALWSLLMPWELGRCSLAAGTRHIDVHNVIWLGTSNIGHELVFEHHQNRPEQDKPLTREEYLQLTDILRPRVSECLGASLLSRVTTVLPFVPFTLEEKKAIAAESVYALGGDSARELSPQEVEALVMKALPHYVPGEGARSLHRAISNQLVDAM